MTFTEAAVEILRLVGKPLHYKKITEIAIERNLLSHVGKTPEITMSSRLATMVRKDRGEAPVVKIKPGVFGLREFSAEVLAEAEKQSGHDVEIPDAPTPEPEAAEEEEKKAPEVSNHPGADVFPEEEDDDEPILAAIGRKKKKREESKEEEGESRRKRRRRRGRRDDDEGSRDRDGRDRDRDGRDRDRDRDGGRDRDGRRRRRKKGRVEGDWERQAPEGEMVGNQLADAVESVMGRRGKTLLNIADRLVEKGRLSGEAAALAPTVAAAIRGDGARRQRAGAAPRFLLDGDEVMLVRQRLPGDAHRAEQDTLKAAARHQDIVRRTFIKRLADLPSASLLELFASWLNAVGVVGVRGVRRPSSSRNEFHLAGTLRQGPMEIPLAIVLVRDGNLTREAIIEARGALHHYGDARAVWMLTLGQALSGAKEEAAASGAVPVGLFDAPAPSASMEEHGIGLRRWSIPMTTLDFALLDGLRGPGFDSGEVDDEEEESDEEGGDKKRRRRRRRRRRGRGDGDSAEATEEGGDETTANTEDDGEGEEAADASGDEPDSGESLLEDDADGETEASDPPDAEEEDEESGHPEDEGDEESDSDDDEDDEVTEDDDDEGAVVVTLDQEEE